jgi:hypothetical protein
VKIRRHAASVAFTTFKNVRFLLAMFACLLSVSVPAAAESNYDATVATWKSPDDVSKWLQSNFVFDKDRQAQVQQQLKATGLENVLTRKAENLFENHNGYCRDSASFAKDALNKINADYRARYIFIKNKYGPPNHWVTGYEVNSKLYVMDFGAGHAWSALEGVHGPYDSLDDYKNYLASLNIKRFGPELVVWRDIQGQVD